MVQKNKPSFNPKKGKPTTRNKTVKNIPYEERHKNDGKNKKRE